VGVGVRGVDAELAKPKAIRLRGLQDPKTVAAQAGQDGAKEAATQDAPERLEFGDHHWGNNRKARSHDKVKDASEEDRPARLSPDVEPMDGGSHGFSD